MFSVIIFAPGYVEFQHPVLLQTIRYETSAIDMTGMLLPGILDVIIVRVMTDRAD